MALTRAFVPGMKERRWGRIVSISSQAGLRGGTFAAHYCVAKAGVTRMEATVFGTEAV